ncbi:hypothetical protein T05_10103 [Trichinella murrelli]|uniref:Uncharacterized protein n=1 Tax=Trichinella murrelli TaxID=144512 RepID=A0A0V0TWR1_9BILA|nr:hypothetical protein T05_10103 [Trichinella murrelli]
MLVVVCHLRSTALNKTTLNGWPAGYFFCAFPNRASAQCEQAFAMAAAVPKVQKASVRSIIASFGLVFSSRRSAFVIVLSTLARVKLAILVGVQCKKFLPKMSRKFYLWG